MKIANKILVLYLLICCFLTGCSDSNSNTMKNWTGGLISEPGTYKAPNFKSTIKVWIDKEHLLKYSIADEKGNILIASQERPSAYSSWIIYFDKNGWLWFDSGDIGTSVAKRNQAGVYEEIPIIDQAELISAMPQEFFARLPQSTQKKWSIIRK